MRKILVLLLLLIAHDTLFAQTSVTARVLDAGNRMPLPYATVLLKGTTRGTITNFDGWFSLPLQSDRDSLRISFVGYRTLIIPFGPQLNGSHILLERAVQELGEAVIRPGEDLYTRVVAASNWLRRSPEVTSKLFYGMETHSDDQPVEVLQGYYSATYKAAMLTSLRFKKGRIGIAPKSDRHFINFNTARAFALMDIHAERGHYPLSPLSFTAPKKLKKAFYAELISSGTGPDAVDHIRVQARDSTRGTFALDLWLVAGGEQVRSLELSCENCRKHPFVPLFPQGRIDSVDMRYKQTWTITAPFIPEVMELEYNTAYTGPDLNDRFHTHAIMHAFDHGNEFIPTLFKWRSGLEEYRMISWLPDDSVFWSRMTPPLPTERQLRDQAFIAEHDLRKNQWYDSLSVHWDLLMPVYKNWSATDRLNFWEITGIWSPKSWQPPDPNKVELYAQLYLDMDTTNGGLHWTSTAVFDPRNSVYMAEPQPWTEVFLRMYFDLCEIQRRKMEAELRRSDITVELARKIYEQHSRQLRNTLDTFMKHTRNGRDGSSLIPWNEKIAKELNIRNLTLELWPMEHVLDKPILIDPR